MGNSGQPDFIPSLQHLSQCGDELVSEHAEWGLQQLASGAGGATGCGDSDGGKT
jgi:hypothetical protein